MKIEKEKKLWKGIKIKHESVFTRIQEKSCDTFQCFFDMD